jgi:hypothetical protein
MIDLALAVTFMMMYSIAHLICYILLDFHVVVYDTELSRIWSFSLPWGEIPRLVIRPRGFLHLAL